MMELIPARQLSASKDCERLVKVSEGLRLESYQCGANKWSIGYGSTDGVTAGMTITESQADILLRKDMAVAEDIVKDFFGDIPMHQGMFDALTSFALNFGPKMGGYSIAAMVRDPAVTDAQIAKKALEYQYTKRDDDGDGDTDAVIDAGLPIRRHREALMMVGFSFEVASQVVTRASLAMREKIIPWIGGGHKEILEAVTPFAELERKARALNAFLEEPEPEPVEHDLFDEPTAMEVAQHESAKAAGYDGSLSDFREHLAGRPGSARISQMTRKLEDVPYGVDPDAGAKPMEGAGRAREFARAKSARDDQDVGRAATAAAAGLGVANTIVSETTTLLDNVTGYAIMFLIMLFVFGAVWWGYGRWREYDAEKKRLQAETDARQVMY